VEEIVALDFSLAEQVMPVYGYNSFVFDAIARGKRIISGSFTINFKRAGYLKTILDEAIGLNYEFNQLRNKGKISENDFEKYKLEDILQLSGKKFDEIATKFEDAIWGIEEQESELIATSDYPYFPNVNEGFDIRITYGPKKESEDMRIKERINPQNQNKRKGSLPSTTVDVINNVQIMSFARSNMATGTDGRVLTETYTFVARDINGTMSYEPNEANNI
jgi:hypothetical protein